MNDQLNKSTDLIPAMLANFHRDRFFGEIVLKLEAGEVTLVKVNTHLKRDGVKKLIS